jgi:hypothetical protein
LLAPSQIDTWRQAATTNTDRTPGVPTHSRRQGTLAASTPSARMTELLSEISRLRGFLGDACRELDAARVDYDRWRSFNHTSFGGVAMAQYWLDLTVWESVLNMHPGLVGIVEIGSWKGGFSWWLWAQACARGMAFHTCDAVVPEHDTPCFDRVDVWANPEIIEGWLEFEPVVLFCDGGNKPRELRTFAPMLQHADSLVFVHDWGTETMPDDVPDCLEPLYDAWLDSLGSITRVFRIRA